MSRIYIVIALSAMLLIPGLVLAKWDFPEPPPADEYGNLLIDRTSTANNVLPVTFSHWSHRRYYTCRVCHSELQFAFKTNVTPITEGLNREGQYCGACHNGKIAFGPTKSNCKKCHNGNRRYGSDKFFQLSYLPVTNFGNEIDWVAALQRKLIRPTTHLNPELAREIKFDKTLLLESKWAMVTPAVFSHTLHLQWLSCDNCHPEIFNIQKKTTEDFDMARNVKGEFCGACHMTVAFPMTDCERCHPGLEQ